MRNLLSNAIKFTPAGGHITISSVHDAGSVNISVKDTGIGMSEEQISSLFCLEQSVPVTGSSEEKGTGLGLLLCKEFVDMHGGVIRAESVPGKGTTFSFTLPDKKT